MNGSFHNGVETVSQAREFLLAFAGRVPAQVGDWDFDDFVSEPKSHPVVERCRLRTRAELFPMLGNATRIEEIAAKIDELIRFLEEHAED